MVTLLYTVRAAMNGHLHVVKYFTEDLGCNPTLPGVRNYTILHIAASEGHLSLMQYLLDDQHVEALCYDDNNHTPLEYACEGGHEEVIHHLVLNLTSYSSLEDIFGNVNINHSPLIL